MERETFGVTIGEETYQLYREPTYGDEAALEDERVEVDTALGPDNKPILKGHKLINRRLLLLKHAIASWPHGKMVTLAGVQALPLRVGRRLTEALQGTEWEDLGEDDGPRGASSNNSSTAGSPPELQMSTEMS